MTTNISMHTVILTNNICNVYLQFQQTILLTTKISTAPMMYMDVATDVPR